MEAISRQSGFLRCVAGLTAIVIFLAIPQALTAQETGTVQGTVTQADDGGPLRGVIVSVRGTGISAVTDRDGRYTLNRVPAGPRTIVVRWLGYRTREVAVTVTAGQTATADAALEPQPVTLSEVIVEGVSRAPERVVEAPAAVSVVDPAVARDFAVTGQAPLAVAKLPGSDVVQSGVNDFNVNVRGFNSSLNRRVLVLMDGRDLAIAFLGSQEWPALSASLDDLGRIEMVRGPGSALYEHVQGRPAPRWCDTGWALWIQVQRGLLPEPNVDEVPHSRRRSRLATGVRGRLRLPRAGHHRSRTAGGPESQSVDAGRGR